MADATKAYATEHEPPVETADMGLVWHIQEDDAYDVSHHDSKSCKYLPISCKSVMLRLAYQVRHVPQANQCASNLIRRTLSGEDRHGCAVWTNSEPEKQA